MNDIVTRLKGYFNAKVVGSYIFVENNLLSIEDINDIDINVEPNIVNNVRLFLTNEGYKETQHPIRARGYEEIEGSLIFEKNEEKTIHLLPKKDLQVYSVSELIAKKFDRNEERDISQLIKVLQNKSNSSQ
jgi:hypothetical protein